MSQMQDLGVDELKGIVCIYYIRHIAQNFMKHFKNATMKRDLVNMGKHFYFENNNFSFPGYLFYLNFFTSICSIHND